MDKIAIISDVHGNLVSLKTVINDIKSQNIKHIFCLGDLVAKGSQPRESIELIKKECEVVIKGNCDEIVGSHCNTIEHVWNREKIGDENAKYLSNLPVAYDFYMSGLKIKLIHASPNDLFNSIKYYDITKNINDELEDMFKFEGEIPDVLIFGHIHSPFFYSLKDKTLVNSGSIANGCDILEKNNSVNQFASYMILEGEYGSKEVSSISYEIVKIPYDFKKEIENLRNSDMPNKEMAIDELETGIYIKR